MMDAKASAARSRYTRLGGARQPRGVMVPATEASASQREAGGESSRELSMMDAKPSAARSRYTRLGGARQPRGTKVPAAEASASQREAEGEGSRELSVKDDPSWRRGPPLCLLRCESTARSFLNDRFNFGDFRGRDHSEQLMELGFLPCSNVL